MCMCVYTHDKEAKKKREERARLAGVSLSLSTYIAKVARLARGASCRPVPYYTRDV